MLAQDSQYLESGLTETKTKILALLLLMLSRSGLLTTASRRISSPSSSESSSPTPTLTAAVTPVPNPSACYSGESLTGSSGIFTSPNFPNSFPQYSNCTWNITVPSGYIIKLTFNQFMLGGAWGEARLNITNVASDDGNQPFHLQVGDQWSIPPVYSVGNSIQVIFTSQDYQYSGFNASYTAITGDSVCPKLASLNETSGVITSPFYPRRYPDDTTCSWRITASKGRHVVLIIQYMEIQQCGLSCSCDHLEVQNGSSFDGLHHLSGRRCGHYNYNYYSSDYYYYYYCNYHHYYPSYCYHWPLIFRSYHESLKVIFRSDGSSTKMDAGFEATYVQVNHAAKITACSSGEGLTGSSGSFSSPNFPNNFPSYIRCTWNITVLNGYIIKLSFHHFMLGYQWGRPRGARLIITNVASDDGYPPLQLFGDYPHPPVYSLGNSIQVIFISLSGQYSGFNASYTAITNDSVCPNMTTLNETSGVITSPFYPRNYPGYQECRWEITASKGKHVVLIIEDMSIPSCGQTCTCDHLEVQNGFSSDGYNGERRCGSSRARYHSMFESLTVLFVSDGSSSKRYRGFKATYLQANHSSLIPACFSGDILSGSSGFFASPNFPNKFPQYSRCVWNITVPSGYIIKLTFHHFELDRYATAGVTITNVASDDNSQPFQLYGQSVPSPVYSVGNSFQVIFSTFIEQYSGFNASYTAITYESVCPKLAILNETSGVITSPFYPRNYPVNQSCSWKISARKGKRINLVIEYMDIADLWGSSCPYDYLEIRNDYFSSNPSSRRLCGRSNGNGKVFSSVENLIVLFGSRYSRDRGFNATYHQVNSNTVSTG